MRLNTAEPLDVAEGDETLEEHDGLEVGEQEALLAALDRGLAQAARGDARDAREVLAALRTRQPGAFIG